jgi:hypothetical protein
MKDEGWKQRWKKMDVRQNVSLWGLLGPAFGKGTNVPQEAGECRDLPCKIHPHIRLNPRRKTEAG